MYTWFENVTRTPIQQENKQCITNMSYCCSQQLIGRGIAACVQINRLNRYERNEHSAYYVTLINEQDYYSQLLRDARDAPRDFFQGERESSECAPKRLSTVIKSERVKFRIPDETNIRRDGIDS